MEPFYIALIHNRKSHRDKTSKSSRRRKRSLFMEPLEARLLLANVGWDGGGDGETWTDPLNWDTDALPGAADAVRIDLSTNLTITLGSDATIQSLDIGSALTGSQTLVVAGSTLSIVESAEVTGSRGRLHLNGAALDGVLVNRGTTIARGDSSIQVYSQESTGSLTIQGSDDFGDATLMVASGVAISGSLQLNSDGDEPHEVTLTLSTGELRTRSSVSVNDGSGGQRTINAPVISHGFFDVRTDLNITAGLDSHSTIRLHSDAILNVEGNFSQHRSSRLDLGISGPIPGDGHGQLNVTATAQLDGQLNLFHEGDDVVPGDDQPLAVLNYASRQGTFSEFRLDIGQDVVYSPKVTDTQVLLAGPMLPDLVTTAATVPTSATLHETIDVSWTVENQGATTYRFRNWEDSVYLSADDQIDSQDRRLHGENFQQPPLRSGASYTQTASITLPPFPAGDAFLLFIADGRINGGRIEGSIYENNGDNNFFAVPITLTNPDVDLTVTDFQAPETIVAGAEFEAVWSVINQGTDASAADNWHDRIRLSTSPSPDDVACCEISTLVDVSHLQKDRALEAMCDSGPRPFDHLRELDF
jgi:hypothetical protein